MENNKEILEEVDDLNIVKESNEVKESDNVEEPQQNIKQEELKDNNFNVVSPCDKEERKVTSNEDVIETVPFPSTDSNKYVEYRDELSTILNKIKSGEIDKSGYDVLLHTVNNVAGSKAIVNNELLPEHPDDMANDIRYSDKVLNTTDEENGFTKLLTTTEVAKDLGMTARQLNNILHEKRIIYKKGKTWVLYSKYDHLISEKYCDYFINEFGNLLKWTEKGRKFIIELLEK